MSKYHNSDQSQAQAAFIAKEIKKAVGSASGIVAQDLVSTDADNNLQLGSDGKLLSKPQDIDFLAHYILASN